MLTPCTLQKNCLNELSTCSVILSAYYFRTFFKLSLSGYIDNESKIAKTVGLLNTYICLEDFRAKALVLLGILRNEEILN